QRRRHHPFLLPDRTHASAGLGTRSARSERDRGTGRRRSRRVAARPRRSDEAEGGDIVTRTLWRPRLLLAAWCVSLASLAHAGPTRTSPIAVAPDGTVFVVNPDSGTVARLDFSGVQGALTHESPVNGTPLTARPRTVTLAGTEVFTANQRTD